MLLRLPLQHKAGVNGGPGVSIPLLLFHGVLSSSSIFALRHLPYFLLFSRRYDTLYEGIANRRAPFNPGLCIPSASATSTLSCMVHACGQCMVFLGYS